VKGWVLGLVVVLGLYQAWGKFGPRNEVLAHAPNAPYVLVYGRDSCGYTGQMRLGLTRQGVAFGYHQVDNDTVADELHGKMQQLGLNTAYYELPVVEVNGRLLLRPELDRVLQIYRESP
jgi:glutaredoxin